MKTTYLDGQISIGIFGLEIIHKFVFSSGIIELAFELSSFQWSYIYNWAPYNTSLDSSLHLGHLLF